MVTNMAESVKQRLLNYARKHKQDYNFVLRQYVLQRLMYRLGSSEYASDFLLKGGIPQHGAGNKSCLNINL